MQQQKFIVNNKTARICSIISNTYFRAPWYDRRQLGVVIDLTTSGSKAAHVTAIVPCPKNRISTAWATFVPPQQQGCEGCMTYEEARS
ncbi:hypothetical protein IG631_06207 [Alternaria alternata]|nr:hypothetical protein IG631_06207 [Alternaria alternata]